MKTFELTLLLLVCAVALVMIAGRLRVPAPSLLALGGAALALLPQAPQIKLDPQLALALFVAPVLLDAAFDTSVRDLRRNWIPVTCLVLIVVGLTTVGVAWIVHLLVPAMSWSAAVVLGAIVAPPDAAAATAVLRQVRLPHRLRIILEGESLLNDASALLIYRLAIAATLGSVTTADIAPTLALGVVGSFMAGYVLSRINYWLLLQVRDPPSSVVLQFVSTFGVWLLAERLGLSPVVTVVVYAITTARMAPAGMAARLRLPSYAVWDTVVFVVNVLAFVLIGLQLRPIFSDLEPQQRIEYLQVAGAVFATVIVVRILWVASYATIARLKKRWFGPGMWPGKKPPTVKGSVLIGWCGMRGIVTLAAAYALPEGFPYRELIVLCAFCVVVGTLVIQGMTLRPLINVLQLREENVVEGEVRSAQVRLAQVALELLDGEDSPESATLRREFSALLDGAGTDGFNGRTAHDELRARVIDAQRNALLRMRDEAEIGDAAFHEVEVQLDWAEASARGLAE
jgi:CPA1 family monovalent cation:H+ antiporter